MKADWTVRDDKGQLLTDFAAKLSPRRGPQAGAATGRPVPAAGLVLLSRDVRAHAVANLQRNRWEIVRIGV